MAFAMQLQVLAVLLHVGGVVLDIVTVVSGDVGDAGGKVVVVLTVPGGRDTVGRPVTSSPGGSGHIVECGIIVRIEE